MRPSGRKADELRKLKITRHYTKYAEGSVLVEFGNTKVICTASCDQNTPKWLKGTGKGWVTAEYSMLPRSTMERSIREITKNKPNGRTLEIQRLIGRSLRSVVYLDALKEKNIIVDCDVIQADGGTRTASITGGCVALIDCLRYMQNHQLISKDPFKKMVAAVSVGLYNDQPITDLDYMEDSNAEMDMNVVMTDDGHFVEVQGSAENGNTFTQEQMDLLMDLARNSIQEIIKVQKSALSEN